MRLSCPRLGWVAPPQIGSEQRYSLFKPRFTLVPKVRPLKRAWQVNAERRFIAQRQQFPAGVLAHGLEPEHLADISRPLRAALLLSRWPQRALHAWRLQQGLQRAGCKPYDTASLPAKVIRETERILTMRSHFLRHPRDKTVFRPLIIHTSERYRRMRSLYHLDQEQYSHVCDVARLVKVRFCIPDFRNARQGISATGLDGERCRFLIRQRFWRYRRFRPPQETVAGRTVQPTRHALEEPPPTFGDPQPTRPRFARVWPYGVRRSRARGEYVVRNPTAPGYRHLPVPIAY